MALGERVFGIEGNGCAPGRAPNAAFLLFCLATGWLLTLYASDNHAVQHCTALASAHLRTTQDAAKCLKQGRPHAMPLEPCGAVLKRRVVGELRSTVNVVDVLRTTHDLLPPAGVSCDVMLVSLLSVLHLVE